MRALGIIGDLHLGKVLYGFDLTPYIRRAMYDFLDLCVLRRVSAAVCLGDVYNTPAPTVLLRKIVSQWVNEFQRAGIDLYLLAGNHDVASSTTAPTALESLRILTTMQGVHVVDRPQLGHGVLLLPFPSPGIYATVDAYTADVERVIGNAWVQLSCAHLGIEGASVGDQDFPYRGDAYMVPACARGLRARLLLGHIHKPQYLTTKTYVVGAAERTSFAERNEERCFAFVEGPGASRLQLVLRPNALRLVQLEPDASWWGTDGHPPTTAELIEENKDKVAGAIVKITPFIDAQAAVDWAWVEEALTAAGALKVIMGPAVSVGTPRHKRSKQAGLAMVEPARAAALWIKSRVKDKRERKRLWSMWKRIQKEADHESERPS